VPESIIIDFERDGGYTGILLHVCIDSHSLSADEIKELNRLLKEARIPEVLSGAPYAGASPDQFTYRLKIQWEGRKHFFQLAEKQVPPSLMPLLQYLTALGRHKKRK
jgi:hypothetical protein